MLFNSIHFIIFFPLVVGVYYALPHRYRWGLLLIASYYFYMCWKPEYILLIIASTGIDYLAGIGMGRKVERKSRRPYLLMSLVTNLGLLIAFKYFNFFSANLNALFNYYNLFYDVPAFQVLLPVGISFYTFQTLSYTIDVYRGQREPERHLGRFALYVAFFPQLVAGPIERSTRLLPQFYQKIKFDYDRTVSGLKLVAWGFFKKLVIADRAAEIVNLVYGNPYEHTGLTLFVATYFFAFQIFCDFSGYSDIAIGTSRILGIDLMKNFNRPYHARSIADFWSRWHISLSTWFRDYLYIPLGGNRTSTSRWYFNLMVVFLLSGFWHGANWTFVVWGAMHGTYLISSIILAPVRNSFSIRFTKRIPDWMTSLFKRLVTFHLVVFAWIFFRANSLNDAVHIVKNLFAGWNAQALTSLDLSPGALAIPLFGILIMELTHIAQARKNVGEWFLEFPQAVRWAAYYGLVLMILLLGEFGSQQFIYFQF